MKIKNILAVTAIAAGAFASMANANHRGDHYGPSRAVPTYYITARVVDVRPLYRWVRHNSPRRDCRYERVVHEHHHKKDSTGATVLGGVIGGALGNRIGRNKSRGRRNSLTALGMVVGGSIARNNHRRNNPGHTDTHVETRRVCRRVNNFHEERRFQGYRVVYRVRGRNYTMRTRRDPGNRVRLRVTARPVL